MTRYILGGVVGVIIGFAAANLMQKTSLDPVNDYNVYDARVYGSFMLGGSTYVDETAAFQLVQNTPLFTITTDDVDRICLTTKQEPNDEIRYLEGHIFLNHDTQLRIYNAIDTEEDRKVSFEFNGFLVDKRGLRAKPAKGYAMYSQPNEDSSEAPPYNRMADFILERPIPADTEDGFPVYHMLEILHHLSPKTIPESCASGFDSGLIALDWDMATTYLWDTSDKTGEN